MADEALPRSEYVEKLLGTGVSADRPKTATDPPCHNDTISVLIHKLFQYLWRFVSYYNNTAFYPNNQECPAANPDATVGFLEILRYLRISGTAGGAWIYPDWGPVFF